MDRAQKLLHERVVRWNNLSATLTLILSARVPCPPYVQKCRHWRKWRFWRNFASQPDDFGDFYANYISRDESNVFANLAILAIFMQVTSPGMSLTCGRIWRFWRFYANYITRDESNVLANLAILAIFMQITSPEKGLTCLRIWRFWRFLCKLHHQRRV